MWKWPALVSIQLLCFQAVYCYSVSGQHSTGATPQNIREPFFEVVEIDRLMEITVERRSRKKQIVEQIYNYPRLLSFVSQLYANGMTLAGFPTDAESYAISIEEIPIRIANLRSTLIGTKIAQISDLHMGRYYRAEHLAEAVALINQQSPDFVCMTGDYVGTYPTDVVEMVEPLLRLNAPTFATLGNHDYKRNSLPYVLQAFEQLPIRLLRNESVQVKSGLWVAGLDDLLYGTPNIGKTLCSVPRDETVILLAHEPDYFRKVVAQELPIALQMSGHTHGGQIQLPARSEDAFGRKMWTPRRALPRYGQLYPPGLLQVGHRSLYTNRGLGFTGPSIRINCPPEITLFTLQAEA